MDFGAAFKRPFTDANKLVIGLVLSIIPLINLFAFGYILECARRTIKRKGAPLADWANWIGLLVKAIAAAIISLIWSIPVLIIGLLTIGLVFINIARYVVAGNIFGAAGALASSFGIATIGALITIIVAVICSLLGAAGVLRYLDKERFGAAFEFSALKAKAFTGTFFGAWLIGLIYLVILSVVLAHALIFIPIFGPIIGIVIAQFIGNLTWWTLLAQAYREL